jgi:aspartyl-tRNA synthetase
MKTNNCGELNAKNAGHEVVLAGWVDTLRVSGKISFLLLRDRTGLVQVFLDKGLTEKFKDLKRESVVQIKGLVNKRPENQIKKEMKTGEVEVAAKELEIIAEAETLPIELDDTTSLDKRLDYRFLDLHKPKIQAIFKVQSNIMAGFREFMIKEHAIEAAFPSIIGASSEGGTDMFTVKYFEKTAYLSQSCQLYKQMLACSMEKVFAVFTCWRAEKHNTLRHLNECRQMDFEMAFANDFDVMDVMGRCVQYIIQKLNAENKEDLELLNVKLNVPSMKYMTFAEVAKLMKKENIEMGEDDLSGEAEKKLGELYPDTIVFVHDWPLSGKPFYIMPKGDGLSCGFDAIYKGMEITSGGQRIHIPKLLIERLKAKGLKPEDFKSYIDSFRFGSPSHSGWGMGVERLTMLLLGIENIREVVLFPRDRDRLTP